SACAQGGADYSSAALDSDEQKASYGIGLNMGGQLAPAGSSLDRAAFMRGIEDAMTEADPAIPAEEIQVALNAFSQMVNERMTAEREEESTANRDAGAAFLAENEAREGVMVTESGLQYEVIAEGDGNTPGPTDAVLLHYRGTLVDGTEFDSSMDGEPVTFNVGQVIPGFSEALQLMSPGANYRIVIPSDIAYGANGSPPVIGPDATLIFELEMFEIVGN
ncbi:MAG: FKBP-type peptidyl-prolyl cis-trans isomerase, partial [Gemmatimonadetes bacterium]|nr:FKBP-type peptidyl-prolyl cis-trans isomerase [Gemmatimonadota bacterium]